MPWRDIASAAAPVFGLHAISEESVRRLGQMLRKRLSEARRRGLVPRLKPRRVAKCVVREDFFDDDDFNDE